MHGGARGTGTGVGRSVVNREQINALSPEPLDRSFLADAFAKMPERWASPVAKTYRHKYRAESRKAANLAVLEVLDSLEGLRFGVASDEGELRAFARARADECFRASARWKDADMALAAMGEVALRYGIALPNGRYVTKTGARARLLDELWWRRQARKVSARNVEAAAVKVGLVSRKAGLYVSDETLNRRRGQKARNERLLASVVAVNDDGQEYSLKELSDLGVSNPVNRRNELMVRLAGFDQLAKAAGHAAEFYTLTAPSRFHARDSATGEENKKYRGETPADAQRYLCKVWSRIRAALHRRGLSIYGFRVAEPHHDGCPHWHMLMFMEPRAVKLVRVLMANYARGIVRPHWYYSKRYGWAVRNGTGVCWLENDGGENGAAKHRFKAEAIDRSKGSAVGYLAKYISKNIDGFGVGEDWEAEEGQDDAKASAKRVDAWASCWGIRQFQQVGGVPVSVWRELRRVEFEDCDDPYFMTLVAVADLGGVDVDGLNGWARYVNMMGGPFVSRRDMPVSVWYEGGADEASSFNKYGEVAATRPVGLVCGEEQYLTRQRVWVFKRSGEAATPWSSVNNCTGDEKNESQMGEKMGPAAVRGGMGSVAGSVDIVDRVRGVGVGGADLTRIPSWDALPAYVQRVRPGLFFDGKGMTWQ